MLVCPAESTGEGCHGPGLGQSCKQDRDIFTFEIQCAEDALGGVIEAQDGSLLVETEDPLPGAVEDGSQPGFALLDLLTAQPDLFDHVLERAGKNADFALVL